MSIVNKKKLFDHSYFIVIPIPEYLIGFLNKRSLTSWTRDDDINESFIEMSWDLMELGIIYINNNREEYNVYRYIEDISSICRCYGLETDDETIKTLLEYLKDLTTSLVSYNILNKNIAIADVTNSALVIEVEESILG